MAKTVSLSAADLKPAGKKPLASSAQRGETSSAELVPLQFKVDPAFKREFRQAALDRGLSLKDFMISLFRERQA